MTPYPWPKLREHTDRRLLGNFARKVGNAATGVATLLSPLTVPTRLWATRRFHTMNDHWAPRGLILTGIGTLLTIALFRPAQYAHTYLDFLTALGPNRAPGVNPVTAFATLTLTGAGPALILLGLSAIASSYAYEYNSWLFIEPREVTRAQKRRIARSTKELENGTYPNDGYARLGVIVDDPLPWRQTRRGQIVERPVTDLGIALVEGMAGSGKSITLLTITEQALRSGAGVAFIDFKGSIDTAQRLAAIADHLGVPFYNFSLVDGDALANIRWDFFSWNKGPAQARATLMQALEFSTEGPAAFYRDIAETWLLLQFRALELVGLNHGESVFDFLYATCSNRALKTRLEPLINGGDPRERDAYVEITAEAATVKDDYLQALRNNISRITSSAEDRVKPPTSRSDDPMLTLRQIEEEGAVLYVSLPATAGNTGIRSLGSLFLSDLTSFVEHRLTTEADRDRRPFVGIVDEASQLQDGATVIEPMLTQNRAADTALIIGTQSTGRFPASTVDEIMQNATTRIQHKSQDMSEVELLTGRYGTMTAWDSTSTSGIEHAIGARTAISAASEQRGQVTRMPRLRAEALLTLEQGEAYIEFSGRQNTVTRRPKDQSWQTRLRTRLGRVLTRVKGDTIAFDLPRVKIVPPAIVRATPTGGRPRQFEDFVRHFHDPHGPGYATNDGTDFAPDVPAARHSPTAGRLAALHEALADPTNAPAAVNRGKGTATATLDFSAWQASEAPADWDPNPPAPEYPDGPGDGEEFVDDQLTPGQTWSPVPGAGGQPGPVGSRPGPQQPPRHPRDIDLGPSPFGPMRKVSKPRPEQSGPSGDDRPDTGQGRPS